MTEDAKILNATNAAAPIELKEGDLWVNLGLEDIPSRTEAKSARGAIRDALAEILGEAPAKCVNIAGSREAGFRGLQVDESVAEEVKGIIESAKVNGFANLSYVEAQTVRTKAGGSPEAIAAAAKEAATVHEQMEVITPDAVIPPAQETQEQPRPTIIDVEAVENTPKEAPAEEPKALPNTEHEEAGAKPDLKMKGGAALASVGLGALLMNKGKSMQKEDSDSRKGKIAKAVGAVLGVVVPAAIAAKVILNNRDADKSRG